MAGQTTGGRLKLKSIDPTVFFVRGDGELRQVVELTIDNAGPAVQAGVAVRFGAHTEQVPIGTVQQGRQQFQIQIPDIRQRTKVEFVLSASGRAQDARTLEWSPERHWHIYVVHTSHHDVGYTDLPSNVFREHDEFMDEIVGFFEETADWPEESQFRYTVEQAWSIVHYLRNRPPEAIEKVVRLMREGRVEVTALFGNQTSELCGHEELIRLLYPAFWLKRRYGVPVRCAELNDVPGLSWGLVSVLAGAGVRYFAPDLPDYHRWGNLKVHGFWDESVVMPRGRPDAFWWVGPDGSRVLFWYGTSGPVDDYARALKGVPARLTELEKRGYPFDVVRFNVLGGHRDNSPPSIRFAQVVRQWNSQWAYPKLIIGTNVAFFEHLEKQCGSEIRTFRGELPNTDYTVGSTCTAKETGINRITHDELLSAEKFATIAAAVSDYKYPASQLNEAYENALLYDEHTWGMGRPMGPAQDGCWSQKSNRAYLAAGLSQDVLVKSLNRIVDQIKLADDGCHVVVFNPLSWQRTDVVNLLVRTPMPCSEPMFARPHHDADAETLELAGGRAIGRHIVEPPADLIEAGFDLIDVASGQRVACQVVELSGPDAPVRHASHRYAIAQYEPPHLKEIVFAAQDVPSVGHKAYRLARARRKRDGRSSIRVGRTSLENRFYRVSLDSKTGAIKSIIDKELDRELVDSAGRRGFNQVIVRQAATGKVSRAGTSSIRKGKAGPVCASLIVTGESLGCPQRTQEIIIYDTIKRIDLATRLLKDATPMLEFYIAFPFRAKGPQFHFEGCHSVIEPLRDQFPGSNSDTYTVQHWANVFDGRMSITWSPIEAAITEFGDLWPGYVTQAHHGVRPPGYGHDFLKAGEMKKGHIYSYVAGNNYRTNFQPMQVGELLFRYSLTSQPGDWQDARVRQFGWGVGSPLVPVCMDGPKGGSLSSVGSFARVDPPNVLLLTLKRAEDGHGVIARLIETEGRATDFELELPFLSVGEARANNVVEEDIEAVPVREHTISATIRPFGIATIRIRG